MNWAIGIGVLAIIALVAWHFAGDAKVVKELSETKIENVRLKSDIDKQNKAIEGLAAGGQALGNEAALAALRKLRAADAARAGVAGGPSGPAAMNRFMAEVLR